MSHIKEDFTGKLTKTRQAIQGYGGVEVYDVYKGTLKWKIEDDKGRHHTIYIPGHTTSQRVMHDSLVPSTGLNKLTRKDRMDKTCDPDGTFCGTFHDRATLVWGNKAFTKTVPLDRQNVFTFDLAGYESLPRSVLKLVMTHTTRHIP
jgi:hypothetical protein